MYPLLLTLISRILLTIPLLLLVRSRSLIAVVLLNSEYLTSPPCTFATTLIFLVAIVLPQLITILLMVVGFHLLLLIPPLTAASRLFPPLILLISIPSTSVQMWRQHPTFRQSVALKFHHILNRDRFLLQLRQN